MRSVACFLKMIGLKIEISVIRLMNESFRLSRGILFCWPRHSLSEGMTSIAYLLSCFFFFFWVAFDRALLLFLAAHHGNIKLAS
jgi:hypothetical protein